MFIISVLIITVHMCACSSPVSSSRSGIYFDTIVNIDIYGAPAEESEQILDECMNICDRYEKLFDKNSAGGDISKINSSDGKSVTVSEDTISLLGTALKYCDLTDGRFDITIYPVSALWDFHEENPSVPDDDKIKNALSHVNWHDLIVDEDNMTVTAKDNVTIDAGAVAKGYIADRIADYLSACPLTGAVINIGGDIRLVGSKAENTPFTIGINDPFNKGSVAAALTLSDAAVATSGIYERAFTVNDTLYHHILDTKTGYPVDTDLESVTVITSDAVDADCLCTVCILLGSEKGMDLIENTADTEAVFIRKDASMIFSSDAAEYIRQ